MPPPSKPRSEGNNEFPPFLRPVPSDGVVHNVNCIPVDGSCDVLYNHMINEKLAFVLGVPGCGKTSLANRFVPYLTEKGKVPIMIEAGASVRRPEEHLEQHKTHATDAVFIIDEAHQAFEIMFDNCTFADVYFKNCRYNVACFSTSATDKFGTTPEKLQPHKFWYFGPTADRGVAADYIERVVQSRGVFNKENEKQELQDHVKKIVNSLFDFCGAHMEVVMVTLKLMINDSFRLPSVMAVLRTTDAPRAVVNGSRLWTDAHKNLAARLLTAGTMSVKHANGEGEMDLIRKGFIAPVRPFDTRSQIVKFSDVAELSWAHSWQVIASHLQKVDALPSMKTGEVTLDSPLGCLLYILPFFDINELFGSRIAGYTSRTGQNTPASEYNFQGALRGSIARALPHFSCISEVRVEKGRIDFVVFPAKLDAQWGFELLLDSDKIKEHKNRFVGGGIYTNAGCTDHLVIDCRTKPMDAEESFEEVAKLVTIAPHQLRGWDVIEVRCPTGEKLAVPRDCVPRVMRDGKIVPALCVDESKLTPKTVWVRSKLGGSAFKVTPLSNDIDSLKKAIKVEESIADANTIKIFEWDIAINAPKTAAVTKPDEPLTGSVADRPYTFTAPPKFVWVRSKLGGTPFRAAPLRNDIDSLKKAIKVEESIAGADTIKIFEWDIATNAAKIETAKPGLALHANTVDTPYTFTAPPKFVWVRSKLEDKLFDAAPLRNDIDSLKEAIQARESITDVDTIKIFEWDSATNAAKTETAKPGLALEHNTVDTPYTFTAPPKFVWVRSKLGGSAFKVAPFENDVDSLQKAINAEESLNVKARNIKIFEWDLDNNAAKTDAAEPDLVLHANTAKTPYTFSI